MIKTIKLFFCFLVLCLNAVFGQSAWTSGTWYGPGAYCSGWPFTIPYGGTQVIHNGFVYTASYCTYNRSPSTYCTTCGTPGTYTDWVRGGAVITCNTVRGSVNSSTTVCSGSNSGTLTLSGHNGSIVRWERSTNNWASKVNITNTSTTQGYNNLVNTTKYRAVVKDGTCTQLNSTDVTITVRANLNAGSIASIQTICNNTSPAAFTNSSSPTGGTGSYNYQWQKSTTSAVAGFSNISGANSSTYNEPGNLTVNTWYRRRVTSGSCGSKNSTAVKITVRADLNAGSIASGQTICYNTSPTAFTNSSAPTGGTGSYNYQWQKSTTSAVAGFSNISGANSSTYNEPGNLTVNTWYRRTVTSGSCGSKNSTAVKITVRADLNAGSIASGQTICYNTSPTAFTNSSSPTGGTGSHNYQWQKSTTTAVAGFSNISGANSSTYNEPGNLTVNTWYRRTVTSGSCESKNSTAVKITVRADLNAGSIASGQTICYNTSPAPFTNSSAPTGGTGSYNYQWQKSTTSSVAGFSNISGANSSTYNEPGNLTVNTWYRRTVTSGSCGSKNSTAVQVIVRADLNAGSIASGQTICNNTSPAAFTNSSAPTGGTGSYNYQWQKSTTSAGAGFSDISGANSSTYNDPGNLTVNTWYRRTVTSGSCEAENSTAVKVTISPNTVGGNVNSSNDVCSGSNSETLTLSGHTGSIVRWESSTDNFSTITEIVNSTITQDYLNITATTKYRAVVKSGVCSSLNSNNATITVNPLPTINSTANGYRCGSGSVNLEAIVSDGTVNWYDAISGGSLIGSGSPWLTNAVESTTTFYAEAISAQGCLSTVRIPADAVVLTAPIVELGNDTAICTDSTVVFDAVTGVGWAWSNGDNTRETTVNTASDYSVVVTGANGCVGYDTINLVINQLPIVNLGIDTAICIDSTITFDALTGTSWVWNNTDITRFINVNTAGDYDVVVTDANNCVNYDTINLVINQLPIVNLGKDTAICVDSTITFDAVTGTNWVWNNSDITRTTNVNTSGDYDVIVTDANGCVNYDTINLVINQLPIVNLGKDTAICVDSTITFDAVTGENWTWNNTDITRITTVNTSGDYDVIVTDANGCVNYDTINLVINQLPIVNLGIDTAICIDSTITFDALTGTSWVWNNTDITRFINVNTAGDYDVVVTDANNCVNYDTINLVINQLPIVNLGKDTAICVDSTITFDAVTGTNWTWNNSDITRTTNVNTSGDYDVIVTDANGCVNYDTINLVINQLPIVNLGKDTAICVDSTITFDAVTGENWTWNNTDITRITTVNTSGDYDVIVTDANGCVNYDTINLVINQLPIVNLGIDTAICIDSTITFDALTGTSWVWNNTDITRFINVNTAGDYDVVVTDANNCVNYDTINLVINQLPIVNLGKDTAICVDSTITFDAVTGTNWVWNNSDITRTTNVNTSGDYDVIVTDANGCVNYDTINLIINQLPIVNLGKDTAICVDSTITFDAVTGENWTWNNTDITRTTTVNTSGDYDVIVTDANGCVNYDTINLVINQLPIVNLGIDTAICIDSTITFDALTGTSWVWNNTDITRFINVNTAGDYDVVVKDANNCVNYDTINLVINQLPIVNLGKDTAICVDSTITFDAVTGENWTWNNTDITRTTNVNTSGDYDVIVTDANGCVNYDTINLVINQLPIVNLGIDTAICIDSTITFDALTGTSWVWNNTDITRFINVNTAGDYDVVVTDANNCVNYDTINLVINQLPIVNLGKDTAICVDSTITFDAVTGTNWTWNNSDITRTTNVNTSGDYDVIVTDANGCVNYDTIKLVINQLPIVNLGKDTAICVDSTITFDAVTGVNWTWNNTDITRTTTANTPGDYDVIVTDANNCVNYDTIKLTINQLPIVNLGKDTAICADSTITFNALIGVNWTWNNADITRTTTVNTSGDYDVVVTDANGCVNYDTINLLINQLPVLNLVRDTSICRENMFILDPASTPNSSSWNRPMEFTWQDGSNDTTFETIGQGVYTVMLKDKFNCVNYDTVRVDTFPTPTPLINVQDTAICLGDSVNLSIATLYNFYAWTNSESFTNTTTVNSTNQYIVRVFDFNGCIGSDTANVIVNMLPNSDIGDSVKLCEFKDLYLEVPENNAQYLWRSDNTTQTQQIHTSGTYWVSVIDTNNCSSSDTVYIYNGEKIPVNLGNDTTICNGTTLTLDASYVHTEIWQSTDSAEVYYAAAADTFDVLVINSEGCYGRDTIIIKVSEIPDVQIIQEDSLPLCELAFEEKIISILNDEGMDIIWNTGETNNEITVTETNSYIVSKTNIYQCTGKDTIEVYEYCRPVTLTMPNIFTPNGDEVNDVFHPLETPLETLDYLMSHTVEISFAVYNRWGTVIYTSNNVLPYWDGLIQNSGIESSQGTYYWILKYADVSGGNYKENGFVELVR